MEKRIKWALFIVLLMTVLPAAVSADESRGLRIVDQSSGKPIPGAVVTLDGATLHADPQGLFPSPKNGACLRVRAHGYRRAEMALAEAPEGLPAEIKLAPLSPKALYLSFYGIGSKALLDPALKLIEETELNALVIDVKGDRGMIPYRSSVALAAEVGAQKIITVRDAAAMIRSLKERGIYTIGRIVVFKDHLLATARPELAVKTPSGGTWTDRENLAWVDPFHKEVWDYNIRIAVEAAQLGFDEIQFDYVRFPDSRSPRFSQPSTEASRVNAIAGFLKEASNRLQPYNVFTAADIFGYVCWNLNDTDIGQKLEPLAAAVDYLSPMLYPSGFQFGIPGVRNPVQNPHEIIYLSLKKAQDRTGLSPVRFRPWLQAFKDYAFDRRPFDSKEIQDQISAADKFGSQGWMLWNPGNRYTDEALKKEIQTAGVGKIAKIP
jgi:hypothetical protein